MKYSTSLLKLPMVLCIVGCIALGCKKEKENILPNDSLVQKNVSVAEISLNNLIVGLDSAKIVFEGSHYLLDTISIGDIVVSGIHKNAPFGYAVVVTDVIRSGSKTTLSTRFAALTEIFKEAKINATYPFSIDDTLRNTGFDFTGPFSIGNTNLIVDCHIDPTLIFDVEIQESKLIYSKIGVELNSTHNMDVNFTGVDSEARKTLMREKRIKPFTVLVYGIPIVVTPKIAAYAIANCSATVNVNAKIEGEVSFKGFSEYTEELGWKPSSTNSFSSQLTDFSIDENISVKFLTAIEPEITISLYNVDALRAVITTQTPYFLGVINAKVDSCSGQPSIECEASVGINASGNFSVKGLDGIENNFGLQIFDFKKNVGQGICGCPGAFTTIEISADSCDSNGIGNNFYLRLFIDGTDLSNTYNLKINCVDYGTQNYNNIIYIPINRNEVGETFEVKVTDTEHNTCIRTQTINKPCFCPAILIDSRDGQEYPVVEIGGKCWMAKNLNIGLMKNIDVYWGPSGVCWYVNHPDNQINNNTIEKYCPDNDPNNCILYGGLYQWNELMQYSTVEGARGICPNGWHIPSDSEWKELEITLGMSPADANMDGGNRGSDQGDQLKIFADCSGTINCGITGFNATSIGFYTGKGIFWPNEGRYWTSSKCSDCKAIERYLIKGSPKIGRLISGTSNCNNVSNIYESYSCRCVKD